MVSTVAINELWLIQEHIDQQASEFLGVTYSAMLVQLSNLFHDGVIVQKCYYSSRLALNCIYTLLVVVIENCNSPLG